jgi:hypothetical protein
MSVAVIRRELVAQTLFRMNCCWPALPGPHQRAEARRLVRLLINILQNNKDPRECLLSIPEVDEVWHSVVWGHPRLYKRVCCALGHSLYAYDYAF